VRAVLTPGHTAEHTCFVLTYKDQSLALIGDLSHHAVLLLEKPETHFIYDLSPEDAVKSRNEFFQMLATTRMAVLGYHFPWPGLGHVMAEQDHFRFVPEPIRWINS